MSDLKQDAAAGLQSLATRAEGEIEAVFSFPPELAVFSGHFPGRPIVPGILELEMVRATMEKFTGCALRIVSVEKAKFLREVKPGDRILLDLSFTPPGGRFSVKGRALVGTEKAAQVELTLEVELAK
jgi:3-hydroxyacyl-[acyl-carrier-protein] dehydratase